jgi:hypothetical protein
MDGMDTDGYEWVRGSLLDMRDGARKKKKKTTCSYVGTVRQGRRAALIIKQGDVEI